MIYSCENERAELSLGVDAIGPTPTFDPPTHTQAFQPDPQRAHALLQDCIRTYSTHS